jgi:hypothetical protein
VRPFSDQCSNVCTPSCVGLPVDVCMVDTRR